SPTHAPASPAACARRTTTTAAPGTTPSTRVTSRRTRAASRPRDTVPAGRALRRGAPRARGVIAPPTTAAAHGSRGEREQDAEQAEAGPPEPGTAELAH